MPIKYARTGVAFALLPLALATACAGYAEQDVSVEAEQDVLLDAERDVGSVNEPLLVAIDLEDRGCDEEQTGNIQSAHRLGRIASRSAAFQVCMAQATASSLTRHFSGTPGESALDTCAAPGRTCPRSLAR
jgi:hypothetical protein